MAEFFGLEDTDDPIFWKANYLILRNLAEWEGYTLRPNGIGYIDVDFLRDQGAVFPTSLDEEKQDIKNRKALRRASNVGATNDADMWRLNARIAEAAMRHLGIELPKDEQGFYDLDAMRDFGLLPPKQIKPEPN